MVSQSTHIYYGQSITNVPNINTGVITRPIVSVQSITEDSVMVVWTPSASLIALEDYTITLREMAVEQQTQTFAPYAGEYAVKFNELKPYTLYGVSVVAMDKAGNRAHSSNEEFWTQETGIYIRPTHV